MVEGHRMRSHISLGSNPDPVPYKPCGLVTSLYLLELLCPLSRENEAFVTWLPCTTTRPCMALGRCLSLLLFSCDPPHPASPPHSDGYCSLPHSSACFLLLFPETPSPTAALGHSTHLSRFSFSSKVPFLQEDCLPPSLLPLNASPTFCDSHLAFNMHCHARPFSLLIAGLLI